MRGETRSQYNGARFIKLLSRRAKLLRKYLNHILRKFKIKNYKDEIKNIPIWKIDSYQAALFSTREFANSIYIQTELLNMGDFSQFRIF